MAFKDAYVPYGGYWSTPFCRWQGSFQNLHAVKFAGETAARALDGRGMSPKQFDGFVFGITIPQPNLFYGGPWLAGLIGAEHLTGPMMGQACATGAKTLAAAAQGVETGANENVLVITADKCSNGPLLAYPNPEAPGGTQDSESWVWDNFGFDPFAKNAMIETGENVAKEVGITKEEQDKVTFMRYQQYQDALEDDKVFQRRYMVLPVEVRDKSGRKVLATVDGDEGIYPTTPEGLEKLKPVLPNGTISYGSQTHPADGNCGIIVATREKARELSKDDKVEIRVCSYGDCKTKTGYMAMAVVPAAKRALESAGVSISDVSAIKTHNPFAVNDIYLSREMDVDIKDMNNYGCSLIYGHPQGPTGTRLIIELIEELAMKGGGRGLFAGCAAGDSAAAVVVEVTVE
jgi:acetyl-CoA acetyltransferase family protein